MTHEIRAGLPVEIRMDDSGAVRVEGYAAVFNEDANIAGMFLERIAPGAFRDAVGRDDVVFLVNHEGLPLARTRSGTLALSEDDRGLRMSAELDGSDPDVRQIVPKMQRGDLDKMSFAFMAERQEWDETGELPRRTIQQARLFDVSVVTTPAYEGTEIGLRSLQEFRGAQGQARRRLRMKSRIR
jgi:HK97 family phage prohead protease